MKISDKEIIDGFIANDPKVIKRFWVGQCTPMFKYIIFKKVFNPQAESEEFINDLYLYLQEKEWSKLLQFDYRSKLTTWLSVVATRFFIKKNNDLLIEKQRVIPLNEKSRNDTGYDPVKKMLIKMDIHNALERMPNARYREILRDLYIHEMEPEAVAIKLNITLANLYNIKHRAIQQIAEIFKNEYGYGQ